MTLMNTLINNIILIPLLLALSSLLFIAFTHSKRLAFNKKEKHPLIANKLLTRHPLVFFSGVKSIFFASNHWNELPFWLEQHGYQVLEINTPRSQYLKSWLDIFFSQIPGRVHLTIQAQQLDTLLPLLNPYKNKIESLSFDYHWLGNQLNEPTKSEYKKTKHRLLHLATQWTWSLHRLATHSKQTKENLESLPRHSVAWMLNSDQRLTSLYYAQSLAEQDFIGKDNKSLHREIASFNLEV